MTAKPDAGAMDGAVSLEDQLRSDVNYERPPRGGEELFDLIGDFSGKRILDYGCGLAPYRKLLECKGATWVGLELVGPACSVIGDGERLPFPDGTFDGVLCAAVLEHMPEPHKTMSEIRRVLVGGGMVFGYVAFLEPFHGMSYYHMSHMGLEHLLLKHGFRPLRIFPSRNGTAFQIECLLFPKYMPIIQPMIRRLLQVFFAVVLEVNCFARWMLRRLQRRTSDADSKHQSQYRHLLALRFAVGFNFIAERVASCGGVRAGYSSLLNGDEHPDATQED